MKSARTGLRFLLAFSAGPSARRSFNLVARRSTLPVSICFSQRRYSRGEKPDNDSDEDILGSFSGTSRQGASALCSQSNSNGPVDLLLTDYVINERGELSPRSASAEGPTLVDLRQLKPKASAFRRKVSRANLRAARDQWLYERAVSVLNRSFTHPQLYQLAREAGTPRVTKNSTKAYMIADLVRRIYGFEDSKAALQESKTEEPQYTKSHAVSKSQLFLLMAAGRSALLELAQQTKTKLAPRIVQGDGTEDVILELLVTGSENSVGEPFGKALAAFVDSIHTEHIDLQIPVEALDATTITALARSTQCAVEPVTPILEKDDQGYTRLQLSAISPYSLALAKSVLSAMQADMYQSSRALFSITSQPQADEDELLILQPPARFFHFMPQPIPTPRSRVVDLAVPKHLQLYRLAASRGPRLPRRGLLSSRRVGDGGNPEVVLSNLEPEGTDEEFTNELSWKQLGENLAIDESALQKVSLPLSDTASVRLNHSIAIGSLLFPSPTAAEAEGPDAVFAYLLTAPLRGSWSLDKARQWLRGFPESTCTVFQIESPVYERRPLWFNTHMPGVAFDADGTFAKPIHRQLHSNDPEHDLRTWTGPAAAASVSSQREFLRYTYRLEQGPDDEVEPIVRLVIDVHEGETTQEVPRQVESQPLMTSLLVQRPASCHDESALDAPWISDDKEEARPAHDAEANRRKIEILRACQYHVQAASLTTCRKVDLLVPEQFQDAQLSSSASAKLSQEAFLKVESSLAEYLAALGDAITKESNGEQIHGSHNARSPPKGSVASTTARLLPYPAPLVDRQGKRPAPPLKIRVGTSILAFERAERIYEASWPLKLPEERQTRDGHDFRDASSSVRDRTSAAVLTSSGKSQDRPQLGDSAVRPRLVETTILSHDTTGSHTSTHIEWTEACGQNGSDDSSMTPSPVSSGWRRRIMDAVPLLPVGTRKGRVMWT